MDEAHTTKSKFLSLVLRHRPAKIGITLDRQGWTSVSELIAKASAHGVVITPDEIRAIVAQSDKQRFALSEDGTRIRANQGHSVEIDLQLEARTPPATLYHGTVSTFLPSIRKSGLIRGKRHHVHLSPDRTTASAVGARRGRPVVLEIDAHRMANEGHLFFRSENGVWLTNHVPPDFIAFPSANSRQPG